MPGVGTFVSVGNRTEPFTRLLDAVRAGLDAGCLPSPITVQRGNTLFDDRRVTVRDFVRMEEFQHLIASCDLVLLHGGAGSVITAHQAGRIPIVMARRPERGEVLDDHQVRFVEILADRGAVIPLEMPTGVCRAAACALAQQRAQALAAPASSALVQAVAQDLTNVTRRVQR